MTSSQNIFWPLTGLLVAFPAPFPTLFTEKTKVVWEKEHFLFLRTGIFSDWEPVCEGTVS